jgi:hypothetical protein
MVIVQICCRRFFFGATSRPKLRKSSKLPASDGFSYTANVTGVRGTDNKLTTFLELERISIESLRFLNAE